MASKRLPGKVMADLCGKPMLAWVLNRTRRARRVAEVVVATTTDPEDDVVEDLCRQRGNRCFRGHTTDVLARVVGAARESGAEVVVRITGDCPWIDPGLIDEVVAAFLSADPPVALALNRLPWDRTYPIGTDVEVCSLASLEAAHAEANLAHQREHVVPFLYEHPDRFPYLHLRSGGDYGQLRWTVDEESDLRLLREVCHRFPGRDDFSWRELLSFFEQEPELRQWNASVHHRGHQDTEI
jgi:spore coat polysaccharide biosynthesis protein SpsF